MSKKKIAFLFPGQGAQYPGMGKSFYDAFASARHTFEEADDLLQMKLSKIIFEGPEEILTETKYSQLAIFVTSIATLRVVEKEMPEWTPSICSGLSLGEYSALYAAKKLGFSEALFLVKERAHFMNEACENTKGTMAAVLGLSADLIDEALQGIDGVWVANYNCPGQTVISGTMDGVLKGTEILKQKGAKRVIPLTVHGAFHSPLMQIAEERLSPYIEKSNIVASDIQLVMNVPGLAVEQAALIKKNLKAQVTHSIRWEEGIRSMEGVDLFIEMGCGKTLAGLNKKIGVTAPTISIDTVTDLNQIGSLCSSC